MLGPITKSDMTHHVTGDVTRYQSWKDDRDKHRIIAILAHNSGNWQDVCSAEQSTYHSELQQLEQCRIVKYVP